MVFSVAYLTHSLSSCKVCGVTRISVHPISFSLYVLHLIDREQCGVYARPCVLCTFLTCLRLTCWSHFVSDLHHRLLFPAQLSHCMVFFFFFFFCALLLRVCIQTGVNLSVASAYVTGKSHRNQTDSSHALCSRI